MASLPSIVVEAGVGISPSVAYLYFDDAARGKFDTGRFAPDALWTDISAYVRAFSTTRGRNRSLEQYTPGRCFVIFDNSDGRFDPENLSGPYVSAGATQLKPMVPIRISAVWSGVTYRLYQGYVDEWACTYPGMFDSICTVTATDAFKILGKYQAPSASVAAGAGELAGARINRLLDFAGYSASDRDIDTGIATMQATTLAQPILTELQKATQSEGGDLYVGANGKVTFRQLYARLNRSRSINTQITFTDDATAIAGGTGVAYTDITRAADGDLIRNEVDRTIVGSTIQTASDATSQTAYQKTIDNVSDLVASTDAQALTLANWELYLYKDFEARVAALSVMPASNATVAWPLLLSTEILDRVSVERRPPYGGTITSASFVQGIAWSGDASNWVVRLSLESAKQQTGFFIFDDTTFGKFDTGKLAA